MTERLKGDLPALTGLRGAAALVVISYHYLEAPSAQTGHVTAPFSGYLGVELFFVLSGFLMTLNYGANFGGGWRFPAYRAFLGKRFARVYPLYALATVAVFLIELVRNYPAHVRYRVLGVNMLLGQQLGPGLISAEYGDSILGGAWSISTELGAYLLFPFLFAITCLKSRRAAVATCSTAVAILFFLAFMPATWKLQQLPSQGALDIWSGWDLWPLARCLAEFTLGLAAFRFAQSGMGLWLRAPAVGTFASVLLLGSLFIPGADLASLALILVIVVHLVNRTSSLARVLSSKAFIWLGEVSYAAYILHIAVIDLTYGAPVSIFRSPSIHDRPVLVIGGSFVGLLVISRLAFVLVERPARGLIRTLLGQGKPRPIETEPAMP